MSTTTVIADFMFEVLTTGKYDPDFHVHWLSENVKSDTLAQHLMAAGEMYMLSARNPELFVIHLLELAKDKHLPTQQLYSTVRDVNQRLRRSKKRTLRFTNCSLRPQQLKAMGLAA